MRMALMAFHCLRILTLQTCARWSVVGSSLKLWSEAVVIGELIGMNRANFIINTIVLRT